MMSELDKLDAYLSSDDSPDDCMMLSDLDGFLHGVACSPVPIPVEEWMAVAIGGVPSDLPNWVLEGISVIFLSIIEGLASDPPEVDPIFWEAPEGHVIAMDWCEGFMQAVSLRPKDWLKLTESGIGGQLIMPIIIHILDENGNSVLGISQEDLDQTLNEAAEHIPDAVVAIHRFW
ncbi:MULTISPECIES: YecA family protein [Marivita]|nr:MULTISPECIES: YecA family protein [Marivita]MBM2321015.1 YecA family protein [Marivita cryptomonadis]MBM2340182.1 YecA family protein [Marivita cryptomonadis]MBM2364034.1 YecA family protein [Marivita cryptomonadis]MBM2407304.1 YecA family protein [Marivita cryptomonadis]MBM2421314.1 YecA family protein [Marivita cryptomonadis]